MKTAYLIVAFLSIPLLFWGMERQRREVNLKMTRIDQHMYMHYAKRLARTDFRLVGDGARTPAYPALMALFYRNGMSDDEFFDLGKRVGEVIAIAVLATVFCLFRFYAPLPDALAATLVSAFTVFAYKAPYFQPEILFYGFSLVLFVLTIDLIARPRLAIAAGAGVAGGLAYLTKASVAPAIALCVVCLAARAVLDIWSAGPRIPGSPPGRDSDADRQVTPPELSTGERTPEVSRRSSRSAAALALSCGLVFVLCFLLTVSPYIRNNKARFGRYFYNVNTTFYLWCDSREEAWKGTRAHGDRVGWPDMPEDEIPSLRKYLREHTAGQIVDRFVGGMKSLWKQMSRSYGYVAFVAIYLICILSLAVQNVGECRAWLCNRENAILAFFTVACFGAYLLAYAWFTPISAVHRYVLALFLPAMFVFVRFLSHAQKENWPILKSARGRIPASAVSPAVLTALLVYVVFVFPRRVSTMFGGL